MRHSTLSVNTIKRYSYNLSFWRMMNATRCPFTNILIYLLTWRSLSHRQWHNLIDHIWFLLVTHNNYVRILYCFRDIARLWSKSRLFRPLFSPQYMVAPSEACRHIWCEKTWMKWLTEGIKTLSRFTSAMDRTDAQNSTTYEQTDKQECGSCSTFTTFTHNVSRSKIEELRYYAVSETTSVCQRNV